MKTLISARAALKARQISSVELTTHYLKEMEENRNLNAYVLETPEVALEQAKKLMRA